MEYSEELFWILDEAPGKWVLRTAEENNAAFEENVKKNIAFVHALGEKCDCVGWSKLDLRKPGAGEILDRIEDYCKKQTDDVDQPVFSFFTIFHSAASTR